MTIIDSEAQDRADMADLVSGRDAALSSLMERHGLPIFRFLARVTGNEDDANDLAQETFVRVYRASDRYRPAQSFRTWLFTIAANLARNHKRWRSRHPNISLEARPDPETPNLSESLPSPTPEPTAQLQKRETHALVRQAVGRLPEEMREAVVLCEWEELSLAEAAHILGTTAKAVESRLYRARKRLREDLRGLI